MTIRFIGPLLCSGLLVFAVTTGAAAEGKGKKQTSVDGKAGITGHPDSKVGGSVMMAVRGAQKPAGGTSVKRSKSNSGDKPKPVRPAYRWGAGGAQAGGAQ